MSEKLCLQWNDFHENIKSAIENLREDKDFKDVTLVCEDGQQVEAHKVILASSSPFFQKLLARNKQHHHPLIYMRGMKFDTLLAVLDFLYRGEANVFQEDLDSFLSIAEELQLRGLMGNPYQRVGDLDGNEKRPPPHNLPAFNAETKNLKTSLKRQTSTNAANTIVSAEANTAVTIPNMYSGDVDDLEEMVRSMMEKSENMCQNHNQKAHRCKVCGKEGLGSAIKEHIEANHIEGIVLPCNLCEKTFRARKYLRKHKTVAHHTF